MCSFTERSLCSVPVIRSSICAFLFIHHVSVGVCVCVYVCVCLCLCVLFIQHLSMSESNF